MMAVAASELPVGDEWTYEVKWDGYRTFAVKDGGRATLISRNLKTATGQYPEIAAATTRLDVGTAMLDGELVAVDESGRPSFQALQHRASCRLAIVYYAFDLLHVDGHDLTRRPLEERRRELRRLGLKPPLFLSEPLPGSPREITQAVRRLKLEGIVAKRRDSVYQSGKRSPAWVKVRFVNRQEFVVGGLKPGGANFDSLLVGYYDAGRLLFAGKVRSGFTPLQRAKLFERLRPLASPRCPFVNLPTGKAGRWGEGITLEEMQALRWVRPRAVVEVAFTEWTRDGNLRHAAFAGMRDDKAAGEVRRDG